MKIGIYGGTFDPPHNGHINICKEFLNQLSLDTLYVMPAFVPPHKVVFDNDPYVRYEMSKIAFGDISDKIIVSDLEIKRRGRSYTAETISYFVDYGDYDVYLLCGTDMFLTLDEWYKSSYIFKHSTIVHARRENDCDNELIEYKEAIYKEKYNAKILNLNIDVIELSSSEIRNMVNNEEDVRNFVSEGVYNYINENKLYKNKL